MNCVSCMTCATTSLWGQATPTMPRRRVKLHSVERIKFHWGASQSYVYRSLPFIGIHMDHTRLGVCPAALQSLIFVS